MITVAPEETRPPRLAASPLAWPAVSWPSATGYHQVAFMEGLRLDSISASAPGPTKIAPVQYGSADVAAASTGVAARRSVLQKAEAASTGWMIPVTTSCSGPTFSRVPTRRPSLAAAVVVTAACTTPVAEPPAGSRPASIWL